MANKKKIYIVSIVSYKEKLNIGSTISLSWIEGQVGACPVFTNKKKALKYIKSIGASKEALLEGYVD